MPGDGQPSSCQSVKVVCQDSSICLDGLSPIPGRKTVIWCGNPSENTAFHHMVRRFPPKGDFYSVSPGFPVNVVCQGVCLDGVCQGVKLLSPGIFARQLIGGTGGGGRTCDTDIAAGWQRGRNQTIYQVQQYRTPMNTWYYNKKQESWSRLNFLFDNACVLH